MCGGYTFIGEMLLRVEECSFPSSSSSSSSSDFPSSSEKLSKRNSSTVGDDSINDSGLINDDSKKNFLSKKVNDIGKKEDLEKSTVVKEGRKQKKIEKNINLKAMGRETEEETEEEKEKESGKERYSNRKTINERNNNNNNNYNNNNNNEKDVKTSAPSTAAHYSYYHPLSGSTSATEGVAATRGSYSNFDIDILKPDDEEDRREGQELLQHVEV